MGDAADMAMEIEMGFADEAGIPFDLPREARRFVHKNHLKRSRRFNHLQQIVFDATLDTYTGVRAVHASVIFQGGATKLETVKDVLRWLTRMGYLVERTKNRRKQYRRAKKRTQTNEVRNA